MPVETGRSHGELEGRGVTQARTGSRRSQAVMVVSGPSVT